MESLRGHADRIVVLEGDGTIVKKSFRGPDPEVSYQWALREFDRLQRFAEALVGVEGAGCPEAKELVQAVEPYIRMSRAEGEPMAQHLTGALEQRLLHQLADVIARAVLVYITEFEEPYFDLHFCNMIYDRSSEMVTFIDFGLPYPTEEMPMRLQALTPLEVTLGNLIGSSVFVSARPGSLHHRLRRRQALLLWRLVTHRLLLLAPGALTPGGLLAAAQVAYERPASQGRWYRRLWYRTAGSALARPRRTLEQACRSLEEFLPAASGGPSTSGRP